MEVIRSNYNQILPRFLNLLDKTKMISFDLEMTGIRGDRIFKTDLPFEHYYKEFKPANKFQIIQLGLCLCVEENQSQETNLEDSSCYNSNINSSNINKYYPFNFYLFPKSMSKKLNMNINMGLELESIEFNVKAGGVDWNKWITQGIPYYNSSQMKIIMENYLYKDKFIIKEGLDYRPISFLQEDRLDEMLDKFKYWLSLKSNYVTSLEQLFDNSVNDYLRNEFLVFDFDPKYFKSTMSIKQMFEGKFNDVIFYTIKNPNTNYFLRAIKVKDQDINQFRFLKECNDSKNLKELLWFSSLWTELKNKIKEQEIPVVGHNCLSDIKFMLSHLEENISPNYMDFKRQARHIFPGGIYDTKVLAKELDLGRLSLGKLYKKISSDQNEEDEINTLEIDDEFKFENNVLHNAGYDAFITGKCFNYLNERIENSEIHFKNKLKIFGINHFQMDISNDKTDIIQENKFWGIALARDKIFRKDFAHKINLLFYPKKVINNVLDYISENIDHIENPDEGIPLSHMNFVGSIKHILNKQCSVYQYKLYEKRRCDILRDAKILLIQIENQEEAYEMKDKLKGKAELIPMSEVYSLLLKTYNQRINLLKN